jgi:TNF receptor-associated protein 1
MCNKTSSFWMCIVAADSLKRSEVEVLVPWVKKTLAGMVQNVRVTKRLDAHPCVVTVEEMAAARHFIRTQSHLMNEESRYALLQPQLELNPRWVLMNLYSAFLAL